MLKSLEIQENKLNNKLGIKSLIFNKNVFLKTDEILHFLIKNDINLIVLAGFFAKNTRKLTKSISRQNH